MRKKKADLIIKIRFNRYERGASCDEAIESTKYYDQKSVRELKAILKGDKPMKVIYEPSGKAREYAPLACNLFNGCRHGCKYCYAPGIRRQSLEQWTENPQPRKNILELLEKDARQLGPDPREVLFCFMSDPYQSDEAALITTQALEIMAKYGCRAQVLTKGGMRARGDFGLLRDNDYKFGSSLCSMNDDLPQEWEPNAASSASRIEAIVEAHKMGIHTWVSLEPVLDADEALIVIKHLYPHVDFWKVGKLNYKRGSDPRLKEIEKNINWTKFLNDVTDLLKQNGAKYYIKKDLAAFATD